MSWQDTFLVIMAAFTGIIALCLAVIIDELIKLRQMLALQLDQERFARHFFDRVMVAVPNLLRQLGYRR